MLGKDGRPKPSLVVRTHAPTRRIIFIAAVVLLVALLGAVPAVAGGNVPLQVMSNPAPAQAPFTDVGWLLYLVP